jgi:hypothetical protein
MARNHPAFSPTCAAVLLSALSEQNRAEAMATNLTDSYPMLDAWRQGARRETRSGAVPIAWKEFARRLADVGPQKVGASRRLPAVS